MRAANLFQLGDFTLASGQTSRFKIECDALTHEDWVCLAELLVERLPKFGSVVSVPTGGDYLAKILRTYAAPELAANPVKLVPPVLIVDDVLSTGRSIQRVAAEVMRRLPDARLGQALDITRPVLGAVVFARGPCPEWIMPLFRMVGC